MSSEQIGYLFNNAIFLLLTLFILIYVLAKRKLFQSEKYFKVACLLLCVMIIARIGGEMYNPLPGTILEYVKVACLFSFYWILPTITYYLFLYILQIFAVKCSDLKKFLFFIPIIIYHGLLIADLCVFKLDQVGNGWSGLFYIMPFLYLLCSAIVTIVKREKVDAFISFALLLIFVFLITAFTLQGLFYQKGVNFTSGSLSISTFSIFLIVSLDLSNRDPLTHLLNREALRSAIKYYCYLNNKLHKEIEIIMIDIDGFKNINDSFGHNEGDRALIKAAKIISSSSGEGVRCYRYGGDEFIIIHVIKKRKVGVIKEDIEKELLLHNEKYKDGDYQINFSIGSNVYTKESLNDIEFINMVDKLMYEDKKRGTSTNQSFIGKKDDNL